MSSTKQSPGLRKIYVCLYCAPTCLTPHAQLVGRHVWQRAFGYERSVVLHFPMIQLCNGLIRRQGPHHRKQRKMFNPVFSTAHMRQMGMDFRSAGQSSVLT